MAATTYDLGIVKGAKGDTGDGVFVAIYGETTYAEIKAAYEANRAVFLKHTATTKKNMILCNLTNNAAQFSSCFDSDSSDYAELRKAIVTNANGWSYKIVKLARYEEV